MVGVELQQGVVENTSSGGSTADLAREYFRALDREVVEQLYQLYVWIFCRIICCKLIILFYIYIC